MIPIHIPALRERQGDIYLLFRKFATDFAEKSHSTAISLTPEAEKLLESYRWDGNIRQLKNITDQISIIEKERVITAEVLEKYLPNRISTSLVLLPRDESTEGLSERDILYRVLFDMKKDITELRNTVNHLMNGQQPEQNYPAASTVALVGDTVVSRVSEDEPEDIEQGCMEILSNEENAMPKTESLSLMQIEKEMIIKALDKYKGHRKEAAKELGISERTLYRKIKEYQLES